MSTETTEVADELVDRADITDGKAIVSFSKTEAALAGLRERHQGVIFDLTTTAGDKAARGARLELTQLRTGLEAKRKAFKAPVLEMGKAIDEQAKRITGEILLLEDPIDAQIKADEARREAIRAEKARIEAERVAKHRANAEKIREVLTRAQGLPSARVRAAIDAVTAIEIDAAEWEDFAEEGVSARAETLSKLGVLLEQTEAKEAEAARLEAQRIENERIAAEQAAEKERLAAQQREIEEAQRKLAAEKLERERAEAARQQRITARFDDLVTKLGYTAEVASAQIDAAILQLTSNEPNEDLFGERVGEAATLHAEALDSLRAVKPMAMAREEAERAARFAEQVATFQVSSEQAAPAPVDVVPVAAPVSQVRQPDPAPAPAEEDYTFNIADINDVIKPFKIDAAGMGQLGFVGVKRGPSTLFKRSDVLKLGGVGADHLLKATAVKSLEKAA